MIVVSDMLDAVIAAYMLAFEAGDVPNRQELLDRYPEHADAVRAFFADLDRVDRIASRLQIADDLEAPAGGDGDGHTALPTVRYFGDYLPPPLGGQRWKPVMVVLMR